MSIALIAPDELRRLLASGDAPPVIVDTRPRADHDHGHIPGAVWLDWKECSAPVAPREGLGAAGPGYWGLLREPAELAAMLGARGIGSDAPIVVYADGRTSKGREGRAAWLLLYLGAESVGLLDGGWRGWVRAGGASETRTLELGPARFALNVQEHRRARLDELKRAFQRGALPQFVDARDSDEFRGRKHDYMPRMGHLPAAVLFPFDDAFADDDTFIDRDRYQARLPDAMRRADNLVAYCEFGLRASLVALLHELHTGTVVRVFDGALMQWSLDPDLPVLTDPACQSL